MLLSYYPNDGDRLAAMRSPEIAIVDLIAGGHVYYRTAPAHGKQYTSHRMPIEQWRKDEAKKWLNLG